jgi:hypothetical protein
MTKPLAGLFLSALYLPPLVVVAAFSARTKSALTHRVVAIAADASEWMLPARGLGILQCHLQIVLYYLCCVVCKISHCICLSLA